MKAFFVLLLGTVPVNADFHTLFVQWFRSVVHQQPLCQRYCDQFLHRVIDQPPRPQYQPVYQPEYGHRVQREPDTSIFTLCNVECHLHTNACEDYIDRFQGIYRMCRYANVLASYDEDPNQAFDGVMLQAYECEREEGKYLEIEGFRCDPKLVFPYTLTDE